MVVLIKTLQVILAFSIIVLVHEFGHFFFSKIFHIKVEKFFIFFDVGGKFLFSTKRSKWFTAMFPKALEKETEYGIGWLPLGGYCKIAGMVDESMDMDALKNEPEEWEFRTHPSWQRLLVMAGGVLNNMILALLVYCAIMGIWGESFIPNRDARIYVNDLAYDMGFRSGDHIISFDEYIPENFGMLQADLIRHETTRAKVLRGQDTVTICIDKSRTSEMLVSPDMFDLAIPFVIDSLMQGSPNESCGLVRGDRILAIDSNEVEFMQDSRKLLQEAAGRRVSLLVDRDGGRISIDAEVDSLGRIGVFMQMPEIEHMDYAGLACIPAGFRLTGKTLSGYLKDLKMLARPQTGAYKSVGSVIAIGQVFPSSWDWYQFMYLLALLSIMIGVMNLIPIPGLDGGHILFTLYEMVSGRKPSDRFLYIAQLVGLAILIALMVLAFGNDIGRIIG